MEENGVVLRVGRRGAGGEEGKEGNGNPRARGRVNRISVIE